MQILNREEEIQARWVEIHNTTEAPEFNLVCCSAYVCMPLTVPIHADCVSCTERSGSGTLGRESQHNRRPRVQSGLLFCLRMHATDRANTCRLCELCREKWFRHREVVQARWVESHNTTEAPEFNLVCCSAYVCMPLTVPIHADCREVVQARWVESHNTTDAPEFNLVCCSAYVCMPLTVPIHADCREVVQARWVESHNTTDAPEFNLVCCSAYVCMPLTVPIHADCVSCAERSGSGTLGRESQHNRRPEFNLVCCSAYVCMPLTVPIHADCVSCAERSGSGTLGRESQHNRSSRVQSGLLFCLRMHATDRANTCRLCELCREKWFRHVVSKVTTQQTPQSSIWSVVLLTYACH
ncbi:hypothetical protein J6590_041886 [Homalodisca vitripennis]|nr:hypothetical protein J6590_041886 [Homalodisca vitripennis]